MTPAAHRIANFLCSMPSGHTTAPREVVKDLLLETGGQLLAQGSLYDVKAKPIGAGVYRVSLSPWRQKP